MKRIYFLVLVILTIASVGLIVFFMWHENKAHLHSEDQSVRPIQRSPFQSYISGVGVVEPSGDNISIGTPVNRIVENVAVKVGDQVKKGDVLFQLENRDLQSALLAKEADFNIALARLEKLKAPPRSEDISSAEAAVQSARVEMDQAKSQYEMAQSVGDIGAISQEELNRRLFHVQEAEAKWHQAQANLDKIKAGTWDPDVKIAYLEALQAKAGIEQVKTEIQRTVIRSPIDGKVLQINIHEGESTPLDTSRNPTMIVGNTSELCLRVSINQFDAPNFQPQAPAVAFLRGDGKVSFPLEFAHIDPYLVNKQNLTHDLTERVDTRVLPITYCFKEGHPPVYVGQQMDVFIKTDNQP